MNDLKLKNIVVDSKESTNKEETVATFNGNVDFKYIIDGENQTYTKNSTEICTSIDVLEDLMAKQAQMKEKFKENITKTNTIQDEINSINEDYVKHDEAISNLKSTSQTLIRTSETLDSNIKDLIGRTTALESVNANDEIDKLKIKTKQFKDDGSVEDLKIDYTGIVKNNDGTTEKVVGMSHTTTEICTQLDDIRNRINFIKDGNKLVNPVITGASFSNEGGSNLFHNTPIFIRGFKISRTGNTGETSIVDIYNSTDVKNAIDMVNEINTKY